MVSSIDNLKLYPNLISTKTYEQKAVLLQTFSSLLENLRILNDNNFDNKQEYNRINAKIKEYNEIIGKISSPLARRRYWPKAHNCNTARMDELPL